MTPTQLRAFHLVAEQGSFSAAARASGLSQPNLSGQVTALVARPPRFGATVKHVDASAAKATAAADTPQ